MDIDKFKMINDTYGHDIGDEVLSCLVSVLNEKIMLGINGLPPFSISAGVTFSVLESVKLFL